MTEKEKTPADLVEERLKLEEILGVSGKRLSEYQAPFKERLEQINSQLLAWLNLNKMDKFSCDFGTAYKSTLLNLKIKDREKLLDFALEHWDEIGNELLMISAQKDAVKNFMDEHNGQPPVGISTSFFTRINVRRS